MKSSPSFLDRLFSFGSSKKPESSAATTTRPEWINGKRAPIRRPFRARAYHEASYMERTPMAYGPYSSNLD